MHGILVVNGFMKLNKFFDVYDMLKKSAKELDIDLEIKTSKELSSRMVGEKFFVTKPDFVLFWDKDVHLARRLEREGVRLFNSAKVVEICDSKILTALALQEKVKMPKTIIAPKTFENINYNDTAFVEEAVKKLGLPVVIKEAYGSFGQQVYLANTTEEAVKIVKSLGCKEFLMQEFISCSFGTDVRINVVGNKVVSAIFRQNKNDFRSNISNGGSGENCTPTKEQKELAVSVSKILGADFLGVDILTGEKGEAILCEVNSNPNFKSTLEVTGKDMSKDIMRYVKEQIK